MKGDTVILMKGDTVILIRSYNGRRILPSVVTYEQRLLGCPFIGPFQPHPLTSGAVSHQ